MGLLVENYLGPFTNPPPQKKGWIGKTRNCNKTYVQEKKHSSGKITTEKRWRNNYAEVGLHQEKVLWSAVQQ